MSKSSRTRRRYKKSWAGQTQLDAYLNPKSTSDIAAPRRGVISLNSSDESDGPGSNRPRRKYLARQASQSPDYSDPTYLGLSASKPPKGVHTIPFFCLKNLATPDTRRKNFGCCFSASFEVAESGSEL